MSRPKVIADPFKRNKTRYRGITFRVKADGGKTYAVFHAGRYWPVEGGEQESIAKQTELRGKAARGEKPAVAAKETFTEIAEQWYESKHRLRPYTRRCYRATLDRILIPRFGSMEIALITVEHVAALIRDLEKNGLAPATINDYTKPFNGTMKYALRRRLISIDPNSLLTRDDRPRPRERRPEHIWSDEEMLALLAAAERLGRQPEARYNYSPILRTALATGLRLGELLGLQWNDIDLHAGEMHVRRQWTRLAEYAPPKTAAAVRRVPLSPDIVAYLRKHKLSAEFSKDDHPVFASKSGRPLGHRNATGRGFEPAAKAASIDGVSFHSMRHAFASRMIDRGISSTVLAKLMGHESSAITERRYIHLYDQQRTDDSVREAMAW